MHEMHGPLFGLEFYNLGWLVLLKSQGGYVIHTYMHVQ